MTIGLLYYYEEKLFLSIIFHMIYLLLYLYIILKYEMIITMLNISSLSLKRNVWKKYLNILHYILYFTFISVKKLNMV